MMYRLRPVLLSLMLALAGALLCTAGANAQNGPIQILVRRSPGGGVDIGARIVGEKISPSLGQPVVVENRPGASTRIAVQALKAQRPDPAGRTGRDRHAVPACVSRGRV